MSLLIQYQCKVQYEYYPPTLNIIFYFFFHIKYQTKNVTQVHYNVHHINWGLG